MSQAKVDKYKAEKANRKEIMAKEKRQKMLVKIVGSIIGVVLVAWIAVSAGVSIYNSRPVDKIYVTTAGLDEYLNGLSKEEAESETDKEDSKEDEKSTEESK